MFLGGEYGVVYNSLEDFIKHAQENIEELTASNGRLDDLKAENAKLREEIGRLKGQRK